MTAFDQSAPLNDSDYLLIRQATVHYKAIRTSARTALTSSVITFLIGISAVPLVLLWPSWEGAIIAVGLCLVGIVEYMGYRKMRRADPAAARILGRNQLALLGLIVLYCVVQMVVFSPEQAQTEAISPEVRSQLDAMMPGMSEAVDAEIGHWAPLVTYGFYGLIILLSLVFQAGMALYYFTRKRYIEAFNEQTPKWVRRVFTETGFW
ncbi:MAG: hypothetical protein GY847_40085 [Proteobacteria bacterium]|nr:hypothetical protein [Pseudomonadota bacterium]